MALTRGHLPKDLETLTTFALTQALELEKLRFEIAVLKRQKYGRSSEQADRELLQMQLRLEDLESELAARPAHTQPTPKEPAVKPVRRPLPEHLPRESIVHQSACACPDCGGALRPAGENVAETLVWVPERYKVIRHVRPKFACVKCDKFVQAPAPARPIARGLAGLGLLAHVLVSKYADHLPLYRQNQIFARDGIDLDRSTLADWVGGASALLAPLIEALGRYVMSAEKLHADDSPVPVLAPGRGTTSRAGCGPTCVMIGLPEPKSRPPCSCATRPIARPSGPRRI